MTLPDLAADCAACAGLCCMAFEFEPGPDFAFAKPAGTACPHLDRGNRCAIHGQRTDMGMSGCLQYDCLGAGQRVTNDLFAGADWRGNPALATRMIDALRNLRHVHQLIELLHAADALPLDPENRAERAALLDALAIDWTETGLMGFETGDLPGRVQAFLRGLRPLASHRRPA